MEINEEEQIKFEKIASTFQFKYMGGNENCEEILNSIDKDVKMSEIRFSESAITLTH